MEYWNPQRHPKRCPDRSGIQSICQMVLGTGAPLQNVSRNLSFLLQGLWTAGFATTCMVDMPQGSPLLDEGPLIHFLCHNGQYC